MKIVYILIVASALFFALAGVQAYTIYQRDVARQECTANARSFTQFILAGDPELANMNVKVGACALAALPNVPQWMCELHANNGSVPFAFPLPGFECDPKSVTGFGRMREITLFD